MIAVSYIMKRKIKKIFYEVISNSKIFNIIFFQRNCQRPRFSQTYRGETRQRGGGDWTASNTVFVYQLILSRRSWTGVQLQRKLARFLSPSEIKFI